MSKTPKKARTPKARAPRRDALGFSPPLTPAEAVAAAQRTGNAALVAQVRRELGMSAALAEVE